MPALLTSSVGASGKLRDGGFHGVGIGDIDAHEPMREAFQLLRLADIEGVDLCAGLAERVGDRPADAAAAAGDDGPVIAKIETRLAGKFRFDEHRRGPQPSGLVETELLRGTEPTALEIGEQIVVLPIDLGAHLLDPQRAEVGQQLRHQARPTPLFR